jgi:hypothetical protein
MKKFEELHSRLLWLINRIETDEVELIRTLMAQDAEQGWRFYGSTSLWDYAVRVLKISDEKRVGRYISVARAAAVVPEALGALEQGELTFSHVLGMAPVLKDPEVPMEEKKAWVEIGKVGTVEDLRNKIIDSKPDSVAREGESVRKTSKTLTKISFLVNEEDKKILDQMKAVLRCKKFKDAFLKLSKEAIKTKDPYEKALRAKARKEKRGAAAKSTAKINEKESSVNVKMKADAAPTDSEKPPSEKAISDHDGTSTPFKRSNVPSPEKTYKIIARETPIKKSRYLNSEARH